MLRLRSYGDSGPVVLVLHGGPGAAGDAAPLARELARSFRVLEPLQRPSGGPRPLTVADHILDLRDLISDRQAPTPPAVVGHSWGAMLALAFASAHLGLAGPLVLVGCGTFDLAARARLHAILEERDPGGLARSDPDRLLPLYSCDLIASASEPVEFDPRAQRETWADMLRLQSEGVYPAAFSVIRGPVLMLHGAQDPHPGPMIFDTLRRHIPQIEYRQFDRCGHYPWLEKSARTPFFAALNEWLHAKIAR